MLNKLPRELKGQIFLTSPAVALLLAIPLCILYQADWETCIRVIALFLTWVSVTWAVVLGTSGWSVLAKKPWTFRVLVNQTILFLISWLVILVMPLIKLHSAFPRYDLIALMLSVSISLNLFVHTVYRLGLVREDAMKLHVENSALRYAKLQAEFDRLKEQINPHFLFNALNTSKSLVREDPAGAERYIIHLSDFLRSTIQQHDMMVTLAEEMAMCHNYMELQRIRFGKALQFQQAVDREHLRMKLPYFALTTLVENAIKHNALTVELPVTVEISTEGDHIFVQNNVRQRRHADTTRTGLNNLDERCRLLTGSGIDVQDGEGSYKVRIKLTPP